MTGPPVIGLLGGIGSGKSAVAGMLASLGCVVSDADRHAHEVLADPAVLARLQERWGPVVLDDEGGADRTAIASIVFGDHEERRWLEEIVHPRVSSMREELFASSVDAPALVIDAPLIIEAGLADRCDRLVFVDTPLELRRERISRNRGWGPDELERRERAQVPVAEKKAMADVVLHNAEDQSALRSAVARMLSETVDSAR